MLALAFSSPRGKLAIKALVTDGAASNPVSFKTKPSRSDISGCYLNSMRTQSEMNGPAPKIRIIFWQYETCESVGYARV